MQDGGWPWPNFYCGRMLSLSSIRVTRLSSSFTAPISVSTLVLRMFTSALRSEKRALSPVLKSLMRALLLTKPTIDTTSPDSDSTVGKAAARNNCVVVISACMLTRFYAGAGVNSTLTFDAPDAGFDSCRIEVAASQFRWIQHSYETSRSSLILIMGRARLPTACWSLQAR